MKCKQFQQIELEDKCQKLLYKFHSKNPTSSYSDQTISKEGNILA